MSFSFVPSIDGTVLIPFRAFRILRIFKLAKAWNKFKKLLATITKIIIEVGPFAVIVIIFFYFASLMGMYLFYQVAKLDSSGLPNKTEGAYPDSNFNNMFDAALSIYILM